MQQLSKYDPERSLQQLRDIDDGVGYSSDKVLARYYDTTRKTIWIWSKDGTLPKPHKIGKNTTRWLNSEVRAMGGCEMTNSIDQMKKLIN